MSTMSPAELSALLHRAFPDLDAHNYTFEAVTSTTLRLRRAVERQHMRPGGTVLGPVLMEVADAAAYFCVVAPLGPDTRVYTTNLAIHFLRRAAMASIVAEARVLKRGRRLAVVEVTLFTAGDEEPVAHATGAYAIEG